jgi:hypothetical protein
VKRSLRCSAACAVAFAGALLAEPVSAQLVASESTRLELRAQAGCSSVEDFSSRVARRSTRIHFVRERARRSLIVELVSTAQGLRGTVTLIEADGTTRARKLTAKTCEEAAEGLALIATVTLDPDALLTEPEPEKSKPEAPAPEKSKPEAPALIEPKRSPRLDEPSETRDVPVRVSFGLAAALMVSLAPELAPGGSLEVALEVNPGKLWSPFFRLSVPHAQRRDVERGAFAASFAFTLPTLDVCPVRLGTRLWAVRPCAYASAGLLKVWGEGGSLEPEAHARLFASAGAALWTGLHISEVFEIIADARAMAPLRRDSFAFDDDVFWRTPALGFSSIVGVAGGFP